MEALWTCDNLKIKYYGSWHFMCKRDGACESHVSSCVGAVAQGMRFIYLFICCWCFGEKGVHAGSGGGGEESFLF